LGDQKVPYYIHSGGDPAYVGWDEDISSENRIVQTVDSKDYQSFIVDSFNKIDSIIDLDFELSNYNDDSLIDIYATEYDPNNDTIGEAFVWDSFVEIEFKVTDDVRENQITIIHELGHALGLDHPDDDGYNQDFDISQTMMSYNDNADLKDIWFTESDIYTLQKIWGEEKDNGVSTNQSASSRKARTKNGSEINKEVEGEITSIFSIFDEQDNDSSINLNEKNMGKISFNKDKVSTNHFESDKKNKNKLDNSDVNKGSYSLAFEKDSLKGFERTSVDSSDAIAALKISSGVTTSYDLIPQNYLMETDFDNNSLTNLMLQNINGISRFTS
jgi:hypothetical protein